MTAGIAAYDGKAALYDAIVGRSAYHRIFWGTSARAYTRFARAALDCVGAEPFAEIGCGSLLFSAPLYSAARSGPVVLLDRSVRMLRRGVSRLRRPLGTSRVTVVQGDAATLPFPDGVSRRF